MTIVEPILHETATISRNGRGHEFTNDAAEIGWHQHRLEPLYLPRMELLVHKAQEIEQILHRIAEMVDLMAIRQVG